MNKRNNKKLKKVRRNRKSDALKNDGKNKKIPKLDDELDVKNDDYKITDTSKNENKNSYDDKQSKEEVALESGNQKISNQKFKNQRNSSISAESINQNRKPKNTKRTFEKVRTSKRYFNKAKSSVLLKNDGKLKSSQKSSFKKTQGNPKVKTERCNFDENEKVTRTKDKNKKPDNKLEEKFKKKEQKISKLKKDSEKLEKKLKPEKKTEKNAKKAITNVSSFTASYLDSGKDDNSGVEASYKSVRAIENTSRKMEERSYQKKKKRHKKQTRLNNKIDKKERNLFYQKNLAEFKKTDEYNKSFKTKQFFKKKRYKKDIIKKHKARTNKRLGKFVKDTGKKLTTYLKAKYKKILIILLPIIILIYLLSNLGLSVMNMAVGVTGNTLSTNYLSDEETLTTANQEFSSFEYALQNEIDNIEINYPSYDAYEIEGDSVGHDINELLSYLTAKNGNFKFNDSLKSELRELFNEVYQKEYRSRTIIQYDSEGNAYDYTILTLTISKRSIDSIAKERFSACENNLIHYKALLEASGGMGDYFGTANGDLSEIIHNPDFENPGLVYTDTKVKALFNEAETHIGKRYVFGANGPENFDCSSFVCWSFTKSGVKNMPRTTAQAIFDDYCTAVDVSSARAGDIIFFTGTYDSGSIISHVGIYAGGGYMLHAGDPIKYSNLNCKYWKDHFYTFGRLKN